MVFLWVGHTEVRNREITRFNNMIPIFVANFGHKRKDNRGSIFSKKNYVPGKC